MSPDSPDAYSLEELIAFTRANCPFYQRLYAALPEKPAFADLPVIDPQTYWDAYARDRRELLTAVQMDGFMVNSGGTTGAPKYSPSTYWEAATAVGMSARSFDEAGLRDGDRVAILFASGNLYASLIFASETLKRVRAKVVQFPIGYSTAFEDAARVIKDFRINVLAGFPTHLLRVIDALDHLEPGLACIERIIYAGELFTPDQQGFLTARFPGLQIHSAGYASVEGGPLGYADAGCRGSEHRAFDGTTRLEIVDEETGEPIEGPGLPGRIVFTTLWRRLMPMIRYPTGDRAQWVEPAGTVDRKFLLLGRAQEAARVGSDILQVADARTLLEPFRGRLGIEEFQLLVTREDLHDALTFRLVSGAGAETLTAGGEEILRAFRAGRGDFDDAANKGIIHPPRVEWVSREQLIVNERTGKLLRVVDRRNG